MGDSELRSHRSSQSIREAAKWSPKFAAITHLSAWRCENRPSRQSIRDVQVAQRAMPGVCLRPAVRRHAKRHQGHDARGIARQDVLPGFLTAGPDIHLVDLSARSAGSPGRADEQAVADPADRHLAARSSPAARETPCRRRGKDGSRDRAAARRSSSRPARRPTTSRPPA